ncbi:MAG: hypothetical protein OHK0023_03200 [Anaerolineae bacterium]
MIPHRFSIYSSHAFDPSRAILLSTVPDPIFVVKQTTPLQPLLDSGALPPDIELQVAENGRVPRAFITRELLLFDVAQSDDPDDPWMVSFCPICNAGAQFHAKHNGIHYTFGAGGIYNAMAILRDINTGSYWDHIRGLCMYGEKAGTQLEQVGLLRHMTAVSAVQTFPDIQIARAPLTGALIEKMDSDDAWRREAQPNWSPRLAATLIHRDDRLPRYDMGLGVWTAQTARYYSVIKLNMLDNATFNTLDGRKLFVYVCPSSGFPDAFYTDATHFIWRGDDLVLNNGQYVREGVVYRTDGKPIRVSRPLQLLQRWYGFAALFPNTEIF